MPALARKRVSDRIARDLARPLCRHSRRDDCGAIWRRRRRAGMRNLLAPWASVTMWRRICIADELKLK
jgi:hypothetical protein